jgi:methionyl aminopeptidase
MLCKAGEIAKEVVDFTKDFVKHGMKLIEIANAIDDKINELGGTPAFPVNLSLDEIAAHYTPVSNDDTIAEGILKIDIGVCARRFYSGYSVFNGSLLKKKSMKR